MFRILKLNSYFLVLISLLCALTSTDLLAVSATQAYLSVDNLKKTVNTSWHLQLEKYKSTIHKAIEQEELYDETHHVFYHAQTHNFRIYQDFIKAWYKLLHPTQHVKNFHFLRSWHDFPSTVDAQTFIEHEEQGIPKSWNDNKQYLVKRMLSVNLSLFGSTVNLGNFGECTFKYFFSNKSIKPPVVENLFIELFKHFDINQKYIPQLMQLADLIQTEEGSLYQIFIPKQLVDQVAFPAQRLGSPFRTPVILSDFDHFNQRHMSFSPLLETYRNNPESIAHIMDRIQGRLLFSQDVLLNPNSGVKIIRYTTIPSDKLSTYKKQFKKLTNHIFKRWLKKIMHHEIAIPGSLNPAEISNFALYYGIV